MGCIFWCSRLLKEVIIIRLKLVSPIPPSVNHYLAYRAVIKNGRPMAVSYKTQEAKKYAEWFTQYVAEEVDKQSWPFVPNKTQHFYADAVFFFDKTSRDANNYFKVMLDAITDTGLIWLDDNVVCERVQRIYYDASNPRIELEIYPVDYIGIFDNASQLDQFKQGCIGCTRNPDKCSVIKKAVEGRVLDDIKNLVCQKRKSRV